MLTIVDEILVQAQWTDLNFSTNECWSSVSVPDLFELRVVLGQSSIVDGEGSLHGPEIVEHAQTLQHTQITFQLVILN